MTKEQVEAMSEQERNRQIAELLGIVECDSWSPMTPFNMMKDNPCEHAKCRPVGMLTEYCKYRDACAEFESFLEPVEQVMLKRAYVFALMQLVGVSPDMDGRWSFVQDFALLSASADNRSKAFLMAMIP